MSATALEHARAALAGEQVWLVGGALRDELLGRSTDDVDLVVAGDPREAARTLARAADGHAFELSGEFGAWRVVARDRSWQADFTALAEGGLDADLRARDLTVNALARPLAGGEIADPTGGLADLDARSLRMTSPAALAADPLRALRAVRLAGQLGFEIEPETAAAAREQAARVAGVAQERVFAELRLIVAGDAVLEGLQELAGLGLTEVVLPELSALRGVTQSRFHHLDVHDHTIAALAAVLEIERDPGPALGEHAAATVAVLAEPLADGLTRAQALRFGALFHDIAKPATRGERADGRITFLGHDEQGAELADAALARLRASARLRAYVAALTRHHLRLGFLVHDAPLSRRAIHRYLLACGDVALDVTVLSIADRLATRGDRAEEAIAAHLELARELLGEALRWPQERAREPLVRGDELAAELGIEPGPELGGLLAEIDAARFAGEVGTRADAVALARSALARR